MYLSITAEFGARGPNCQDRIAIEFFIVQDDGGVIKTTGHVIVDILKKRYPKVHFENICWVERRSDNSVVSTLLLDDSNFSITADEVRVLGEAYPMRNYKFVVSANREEERASSVSNVTCS
jgi:hypothetical protein